MTMRYKTTRADDAGLRQRMKAIAHERRRFGYRRLHVLLKREGYVINHKKLFRALSGPGHNEGGPIVFRASMTHTRNTLRNAMTLSSRRA